MLEAFLKKTFLISVSDTLFQKHPRYVFFFKKKSVSERYQTRNNVLDIDIRNAFLKKNASNIQVKVKSVFFSK